jgi:hypothetical protein
MASSAVVFLIVVVGFSVFPSCDVEQILSGESGSKLYVRVENATSNFATVTLTPGLETTETKKTDATSSESGTVIRVSPGSMSQGYLECSSSVPPPLGFTISASLASGENVQPVMFEGAGTGTPGFDDGSIGLNGERFMLRGTHYTCGDTVLIRIADEDSQGGAGASSTARGIVEHYDPGEEIPTRSLTPDGTGGTDSDGEEPATDITIKITNLTSYFMRTNLANASDAGGQGVNIYVPPGFTTTGTSSCDTRFTLATITVHGLESAYVVLVGDGTGVPGFDGGSIGQVGDRTFIRGEHFNCGDIVSVVITDPGEPAADINDAPSGAGVVSVETPVASK